LFIDYSASGYLTNAATFIGTRFIASALDDVAPVVLPGTTNVADLRLSIVAVPVPAQSRSNFTYTVTVSNAGPAASTGLQIIATLPPNALFLSATSAVANCVFTNNQLTCTATALAVNASLTITVLMRAISDALTARWIVTSAETDPSFANNVSELTVSAPFSCMPPPSGLLAWWPGDRDALDLAGAHHGSFQDGFYARGMVGEAFAFDGFNSFLEVSDVSALRPTNLTVECWVNFSFNQDYAFTIASKPFGNNNANSYSLFYTNGALRAVARLNTSNTVTLAYTWTPTIGSWYHLAYSLDVSNEVLYVNGEIVASSQVNGTILFDGNSHYIGAGVANGYVQYIFQGLIDEPSLYNRALLHNEIRTLYHAGGAGKCTQPVIVPAPLPQGAPNRLYSQSVTMAHGASPYLFSIQSGALPTGLTLTGNGTISGTPTTPGIFNFALRGIDGVGASTTNSFSIDIISCQARPPGVVGWWRGENNALDELGQHNGTMNGGQYGPGRVGSGFVFDGNSSYVGTGGWSPGTRWTIEAWVNPASLDNNSHVLAGGVDYVSDWGLLIASDGEFALQVRTPTGARGAVYSQIGAVVGTWYHLAGSCDGTNASLYINGIWRGSEPVQTNYLATSAGTRIGSSRAFVAADAFTGSIDEVVIYNRPLSASEILAAYNSGAGGKCPGGQPPTITFSVTNHTVSLGSTVLFQASASGTAPFSYQWMLDGVPISGGTGSTLLVSNVQPSHSGLYSVTVGNAAGTTLTTQAAGITVVQMRMLPNLLPVLSINGVVGRTNRIEYQNELTGTNQWQFLTNLTLQAKPQNFGDINGMGRTHRFYRVLLQ
jgi:uncharacterized repeat protein (TIGR01451 family)